MRRGQLDGTIVRYLLGTLLTLVLGLAPLGRTAAGWPSPPPLPSADTLDRLRPEDLFRLHRIGAVRFSPDGQRLAFERVRPGNEGKVKAAPSVPFGEPRSDIWIASVSSGVIHRLTDGGPDGTGWFRPRWSPDGERLALLSVQGNNVHAWVWEASSDRLRQLTDRQVHMENSGPLLVRWLSPSKLLLAVQEAGTPGQGRLLARVSRPGFLAAQSRQRAWSGRESTAYVVKSGLDGEEGPYHNHAEIFLFEVIEQESETLAKGRWPYVQVSPDGRLLATFSLDSVPRDQPFVQGRYDGNNPGVVHLHDSERGACTGEEPGAEATSSSGTTARLFHPEHGTLKWAPDGSAYALLTWTAPGEEDGTRGPRAVAVYDVSKGTLTRVVSSRRSIEDFAWTGEPSLLVRARSRNTGQDGTALDWWRITPDGSWENLTAGMEEVPDRLIPASGPTAVGLAEGELWQVRTDGEPRSLTQDFRPDIFRVFWPESYGALGANVDPWSRPFAVMASDDGESGLWVLRSSGRSAERVTRIPTPERTNFPVGVSPSGQAAAFYSIDSTGTRLWMTHAQSANSGDGKEGPAETTSSPSEGTVDTLLAADRWLKEIDAGEARRFQYEHPSGRDLTAWLLLPPDHSSGERHPAVVNVYPGWVQDEDVPSATAINNVIPGRALQILASEGYAVLFPSIPLPSDSTGPRFDIDEGVLPALRAAVERGYVDSARVGLIGHSYGGYGVYNLVTQTDRFRAAIASAGVTDLRSAYGIFDARSRYGHMLLPLALQIWRMGYWETGQGRMGAPPWKARNRYLRNSPLSYVGQVETPLMMIHGNQDHVPVQQAEMFFTSLFRQGKPAQLVRYSGEGHIIRRRANVLDMWNRIISWFDRYLKQ